MKMKNGQQKVSEEERLLENKGKKERERCDKEIATLKNQSDKKVPRDVWEEVCRESVHGGRT